MKVDKIYCMAGTQPEGGKHIAGNVYVIPFEGSQQDACSLAERLGVRLIGVTVENPNKPKQPATPKPAKFRPLNVLSTRIAIVARSRDWAGRAFVWASSPQGYEYWNTAPRKLGNDHVAALEAMLTQQLQPGMTFSIKDAERVLNGEVRALSLAFTWRYAPQGYKYWQDITTTRELTPEARAILESWIKEAKLYGSKPPGLDCFDLLESPTSQKVMAFVWSETNMHDLWQEECGNLVSAEERGEPRTLSNHARVILEVWHRR